jgi:purine-binding chemotaxis protein CheW
VTAVPHSPPWMPGVINLRGVVVPVIDLRRKFGLPPAGHDEYTVVIIVVVGEHLAGIVVDAVSDVITLAGSDIKPPPLGPRADDGHILGFGAVDERMRILIDVERLISAADTVAAGVAGWSGS